MPVFKKLWIVFLSALFFAGGHAFLCCPAMALASGEIKTYYIRYDVKTSNNKIVDDYLLMVPSKNEFRAEKFSQLTVKGVIFSDTAQSFPDTITRIKHDALKTLLTGNGLKSVKTRDNDTVISYEGVFVAPLTILKHTYTHKKDRLLYETQVTFAPISFPDRWKALWLKYKLKEMLTEFFTWF